MLGICLALACLLTLNALASLAAALLWRGLQGRSRNWTSAGRSRFVFALRVFPSVFAVIFVVTLLIPAYIIHEPRQHPESASLKLAT